MGGGGYNKSIIMFMHNKLAWRHDSCMPFIEKWRRHQVAKGIYVQKNFFSIVPVNCGPIF